MVIPLLGIPSWWVRPGRPRLKTLWDCFSTGDRVRITLHNHRKRVTGCFQFLPISSILVENHTPNHVAETLFPRLLVTTTPHCAPASPIKEPNWAASTWGSHPDPPVCGPLYDQLRRKIIIFNLKYIFIIDLSAGHLTLQCQEYMVIHGLYGSWIPVGA